MELLTSKGVKPGQIEIQGLIQKYKKLFENIPMELPQERNEYVIEIKSGSSPVNVNPYRYPHHRKT